MVKKLVRLTESDLHRIIKESVNKVLKEYDSDIDNDSYFGGGLPDKYFDDYDGHDDIEESTECDGYVVEDSKTEKVISIFRNLNNAQRKCDENYGLSYWGFNFKD